MARRWLALASASAIIFAAALAFFVRPDPGERRLRAFVHHHPPVPIVFTSRSEPASLLPAADVGEGFTYPGQGLWQAREGRLRLLRPDGRVHELTWGRLLPDGSTLIDVMSPSVSIDGRRIYFAGRKATPDHGRFRLYVVNVDGTGLRPLTGGPDDEGCSAVPPMRYRSADDPEIMSDNERRRVDFDDVDPTELYFESGGIAFASSRVPDFGRNSQRRATNIWQMRLDTSEKWPITANRSNDRWPVQLASNFVAFSLWSRNQEVISADERDIVPWEPGQVTARPPVDMWFGAMISPSPGGQFGGLLKPGVPVWRPRPLFNGRFVFQTRRDYNGPTDDLRFEVVQADPGLLGHAPSAEAGPGRRIDALLIPAPQSHPDRESLSMATPSPCPGGHVVLAAAPISGSDTVNPTDFGIWQCDDHWSRGDAEWHLLFDDPAFVDAEPVAVYARRFDRYLDATYTPPANESPPILLADGSTYQGPSGTLFASSLYISMVGDAPGQLYPDRDRPYYGPPPDHSIDQLRIYASYRDRFDDPVQPRVPGGWELLLTAPVARGTGGAQIPAGVPTVLAGFDREGRIVRWGGDGDQPKVYAFAGDHYSAARAGGRHFCVGCHPGHSGLDRDGHRHLERLR